MPNNYGSKIMVLLAILLLPISGAWAEYEETAAEPDWGHIKMLRDRARWNLWRTQNPDVIPNLHNAVLTQNDGSCNLVDVNFRDADLRGADLRSCNLSGADLTGAQLEGAKLQDAYYHHKTRFPEGFSPSDAGMKSG